MRAGKVGSFLKIGVLLGAAALYSGPSSASMISYYLNLTNVDQGGLQDGVNFATVSIDNDTAGKITFTVSMLDALTSIAGTNFGVDKFEFNVAGSSQPLSDSKHAPTGQWTLPAYWGASVAPPLNPADGFGKFEVEVHDGGSHRQSPLSFQIDSLATGLTINSFEELSSNPASQGNVYFAAHIAGLNGPTDSSGAQITSGFFGGSTVIPAVPLPAAGWLLFSGLALVSGTVRRSRQRNN